MTDTTHVVGYGALGREIVGQLSATGSAIRVIQRSRPDDLPPGVEFVAANVLDPPSLVEATAGAGAIICAIGFPYQSEVWERAWPLAMTNLLAACETVRARLVFADNLYLYGPQNRPLNEQMPAVDYGRKPKARAQVSRLWQSFHDTGRVQAVAVRSPDFYGPGIEQSVLGAASLKALARGKPALLLGSADFPHDVAHVADYARAVITLLDAPDDAYGQAWHVPCALTMTLREHLQIAAGALAKPLRLNVVPGWLAPALGLLVPVVREGIEMRFLFDRPYLVDATKFRSRFWSDVVPFTQGIADAAGSFTMTASALGQAASVRSGPAAA